MRISDICSIDFWSKVDLEWSTLKLTIIGEMKMSVGQIDTCKNGHRYFEIGLGCRICSSPKIPRFGRLSGESLMLTRIDNTDGRNYEAWEIACKHWRGRLLTGTMAHYCEDWDGLPVDETCGEFECCTCKLLVRKTLKQLLNVA